MAKTSLKIDVISKDVELQPPISRSLRGYKQKIFRVCGTPRLEFYKNRGVVARLQSGYSPLLREVGRLRGSKKKFGACGALPRENKRVN